MSYDHFGGGMEASNHPHVFSRRRSAAYWGISFFSSRLLWLHCISDLKFTWISHNYDLDFQWTFFNGTKDDCVCVCVFVFVCVCVCRPTWWWTWRPTRSPRRWGRWTRSRIKGRRRWQWWWWYSGALPIHFLWGFGIFSNEFFSGISSSNFGLTRLVAL